MGRCGGGHNRTPTFSGTDHLNRKKSFLKQGQGWKTCFFPPEFGTVHTPCNAHTRRPVYIHTSKFLLGVLPLYTSGPHISGQLSEAALAETPSWHWGMKTCGSERPSLNPTSPFIPASTPPTPPSSLSVVVVVVCMSVRESDRPHLLGLGDVLLLFLLSQLSPRHLPESTGRSGRTKSHHQTTDPRT